MQILIDVRSSWLRKAVAVGCLYLVVAWSTGAAPLSGTYQTVPGSMVQEIGDRLTNGIPYMGNPNVLQRLMPVTATFTFDITGPAPFLTAVIHDAVFEGGPPFEATVHGLALSLPTRFTGGYIGDPQYYGFDWQFTPQVDGSVLWNGTMGFFGGHIWQVNVVNITLVVPEPGIFPLLTLGVGVLAIRRVWRRAPRILPP